MMCERLHRNLRGPLHADNSERDCRDGKSRVEGEGSQGVDLRESQERVGTAPEELTDDDLMVMRVST